MIPYYSVIFGIRTVLIFTHLSMIGCKCLLTLVWYGKIQAISLLGAFLGASLKGIL